MTPYPSRNQNWVISSKGRVIKVARLTTRVFISIRLTFCDALPPSAWRLAWQFCKIARFYTWQRTLLPEHWSLLGPLKPQLRQKQPWSPPVALAGHISNNCPNFWCRSKPLSPSAHLCLKFLPSIYQRPTPLPIREEPEIISVNCQTAVCSGAWAFLHCQPQAAPM